jgi:hypothetical protein
MPAYASLRQHTPAYVSIRQHTSAPGHQRAQPKSPTRRPPLPDLNRRVCSLRTHTKNTHIVACKIAKAIKDPLLLPAFPPEPRGGVDKSKWNTACTEVKVIRLSEAGMVHTYIYHRWLKQYLKDPTFKMGS